MGAAIGMYVVILCVFMVPLMFLIFMLSDIRNFIVGLIILAVIYWFYSWYREWVDAGRPKYVPKYNSMISPAPSTQFAIDWHSKSALV